MIATNDDPIQVHRNWKPTPLTTMIDSAVKRLASTLTGNDNQNHRESRNTIRARIHDAIDEPISTNAKLLHEYARNNDTHMLWRCIARCIERGIIDVTSQSDDEAIRAKGHGKPKIRPTTLTNEADIREECTSPDKALESILLHATSVGKEATRCAKQAKRLKEIINRLMRKAAGFPQRRNIDNTRGAD